MTGLPRISVLDFGHWVRFMASSHGDSSLPPARFLAGQNHLVAASTIPPRDRHEVGISLADGALNSASRIALPRMIIFPRYDRRHEDETPRDENGRRCASQT